MEKFLASIKNTGMRKIFYGLAGLCAIFALCAGRRLSGAEFVACFVPLVGAVMAANFGEHKAKEENKSNAPIPPAA